jgi:CheY-like chemotaxis protein
VSETILVVDDSTFIVDGLVAILKKKGYKTLAAYSGDECLDTLQKQKPDIIILDILMEPMDGWETLEKIKANPDSRAIPVLMFSAKKVTPQEAEIHRINIDDYVAKPVNPKQLLEAIGRVLARKNSFREIIEIAKTAGVEQAKIEEYIALTTSLEVDTNLLKILKFSTDLSQPDQKTQDENRKSIELIEARIKASEERLSELSAALSTVLAQVPVAGSTVQKDK